MLWHALALGGDLGGIGVASGAIQLGEEESASAEAFACLLGGGELMRERHRRHGLERELFRLPEEANEAVALCGARELGGYLVSTLVNLNRLGASTVPDDLAVNRALKIARSLRAEGKVAADGRLNLALPLGGEGTSFKERCDGLAGRNEEGEHTIRARISLAAGGEARAEAWLSTEDGRREGEESQAGQGEEVAEHHGYRSHLIASVRPPMASVQQQKGPA